MRHAAIWSLWLVSSATAADKPAYDSIDDYRPQQVEGWKVLVHRRLFDAEHRQLREQTLRVLGDQLHGVVRVVPAEPLAKLRKIPFWIELNHPKHACMCYHPSADWLREHAMNPAKAGGIEIANCRNFLDWTIPQPCMALHELAHGFHHQVLGFEHAEIRACFQQAVDGKNYENALHIDGRKRRHYALTNEKEYFAEATEAFFGTNDFYPFVRAELKQHDPRVFELLEKLWQSPAKGKK